MYKWFLRLVLLKMTTPQKFLLVHARSYNETVGGKVFGLHPSALLSNPKTQQWSLCT